MDKPTADPKRPDALDVHKFKVTFFTDKSATLAPKTITGTLPQLRDVILKPVGKTKDDLPLLKLASFGKKKTDEGCFRFDDNVTGFDGVELDYDCEYDAKKISFDEAVEKIRQIDFRCLIYTSPSYTVATPKWRILAPLSKPETRVGS
jgi:hypothetical protein